MTTQPENHNIIILGGCGTIGRKLKQAWPDAMSVDKNPAADVVCDLAELAPDNLLFPLLETADVVIHLATSADPAHEDFIHFQSVIHSANLVAACVKAKVPKLIIASSDWAAPKAPHLKVNTYGHAKRVLEAMAEMVAHQKDQDATAIRIGWVPDDTVDLEKVPAWLRENYWDDQKLVEIFRREIENRPKRPPLSPPV